MVPAQNRGFAEVFLLIGVVILAIFLVGGFGSREKRVGEGIPTATTSATINGQCCDLGDGEACKPKKGEGEKFTFRGSEYGLLKSNISLAESVIHLKDSGEKVFGQYPIILNEADGFIPRARTVVPGHGCGNIGDDLLWRGRSCAAVANDQLIYICKENCKPFDTSKPVLLKNFIPSNITPLCASGFLSCYGDQDTKYDVYFKIADEDNIPDFIKNCQVVNVSPNPSSLPKQIISFSPKGQKDSLQLDYFKLLMSEPQEGSSPWISPWCKPAIYLYPEEETFVNVKIAPKGKLTLTIPNYPLSGWNVLASPSGKLNYSNQIFDYLYYEAEISDDLIEKPRDGIVANYNELPEKLNSLLFELGLNVLERQQFLEYWLKVLPKSSYFSVKVISQSNLDVLTPLKITPSPNKIIRVTLYFEALDQPVVLDKPQIKTPSRDGFTVVEWGGIFKKDPRYNFSCLM